MNKVISTAQLQVNRDPIPCAEEIGAAIPLTRSLAAQPNFPSAARNQEHAVGLLAVQGPNALIPCRFRSSRFLSQPHSVFADGQAWMLRRERPIGNPSPIARTASLPPPLPPLLSTRPLSHLNRPHSRELPKNNTNVPKVHIGTLPSSIQASDPTMLNTLPYLQLLISQQQHLRPTPVVVIVRNQGLL